MIPSVFASMEDETITFSNRDEMFGTWENCGGQVC